MVSLVVNSRLHQRKSIPSSSLRVSSTSLTATKHRLAPTFSASQIISHQSLVTGHQSLSLFLSCNSGLFHQNTGGWVPPTSSYEAQNETAHREIHLLCHALLLSLSCRASMPASRFGLPIHALPAASRRTKPGAGRRSLPPPHQEVPRLPNRTGHQPFPPQSLRTPGAEPHFASPRRRSLLHQQLASPHAAAN